MRRRYSDNKYTLNKEHYVPGYNAMYSSEKSIDISEHSTISIFIVKEEDKQVTSKKQAANNLLLPPASCLLLTFLTLRP
jgi:hypothetical protein